MEGKGSQCNDSTGEDSDHVICLSSDGDSVIHLSSDNEGEHFLSTMEENEGREVWDLDSVPKDWVGVSDQEDSASDSNLEYRMPKWNKMGGPSHDREEFRVQEEVGLVISNGEELQDLEMDIDFPVLKKMRNEKTRKRKKDKRTLKWEVWEEDQNRWVENNMMNDIDLENQNEVITETCDASSDLVMPLLRYQKEWLAWALKQEESSTRGGILADEMGMGKTIQAIALVLAKREIRRAVSEPIGHSPSPSSSTALPEIKGTLVICPMVAVRQWENEVDRFTTKGSNMVLVYHGAKREKSLQQFFEYDFVITTYSIVESEYRKTVMPPKQKCQWCGKLFSESKMSTHLKLCGPDAVRTDKQSKQRRKGAKISGKMLKLSVSTDGQSSESEGDEKWVVFKRAMKLNTEENDLGIGSSKDNSAGVEQGVLRRKSILHSVKWDRIILDEAHYIKGRSCNTTKAILALESSYKWALSGTPVQNRVGELYSLVRFLQIFPYSYYFCKDCDCKSLDYRSSTSCPNCPHSFGRHFCWWNKYVSTPIQKRGNSGEGRKAMLLLKHKILKSTMLRRTKKGREEDLALPPRIITLRWDTLDIKEEDYYTSLNNDSQAQFNTYVEAGTLMNNYAHIFVLLTRLRQAVDHPYLVVYSRTAAGSGSLDDAGNGEQVCGLCHDTVEDPVVASCAHIFCKSCFINFPASTGQVLCPSCSEPLTVDFSTNVDHGVQNSKTTIKGFKPSSILNRICLDNFQTSTKIEALREEIRFMVESDGSAKGIVFSQFTSFLDLIHYSLQKSGITCAQLVGSMSMSARDAAILRFTNNPDCKIFLMSLKAGGVALNLTVASHVFLMDPWWNPAAERQAQDRIHRIGQYKPIKVVRFVIENTIEERILELQKKKELVFEGTMGGSSEALGKLTEADLRFLFGS
ncbi:hypothetical protein CsSME_00019273 [Camellia sinensis var. sinensis]